MPVLQFLVAPLVAVFAPDRDGGNAQVLILSSRGLMAGLSALTVLACY
jgi:hypothetical protein